MAAPGRADARPGSDDYPRQAARTRNFSLGVPRSFTVAPDGSRVAFLRTRAGDDPVNCLWVLDVGTGAERLAFDPRAHAYEEDEAVLSPAERARRERVREQAGGVVAYATDREVRRAVFPLGGRLFLADLADGEVPELHPPPVDDPRLDPSGTRVAYVIGGSLHVMEIDGVSRVLAADDEPDVNWGLSEFVAAEEMGRHRGHWWSPDGTHIAAARVDERPVAVWHIGDPADPASAPRAVRYPAAGTDNATVTLSVFDAVTGDRVDIEWDRAAFPYLARVDWSEGAPLTLLVQARDQRAARLLEADYRSGRTTVVREDADPAWVDLPPDSPSRLSDGRLVHVVTADGAGRVLIGGELATPPGLQVRQVPGTRDDVVFTASEEPTEVHVWRVAPGQPPERLTDQPGVHAAAVGGDVLVVTSTTGEDVLPRTEVVAGRSPPWSAWPSGPLSIPARSSSCSVRRGLPHVAVVRGARVRGAGRGRAGTPGRGAAWEREMFRDFTVALDDQVDALHAAAERFGFLDLSRVAIRGWSFGGYLAAMAVLRRPDVFHAAVAGAPATDFAPVRHALHRAVPGPPRRGARGLPAELADRGCAEAGAAAHVDPRAGR